MRITNPNETHPTQEKAVDAHVCAGLQHVVPMPSRNWDESNSGRVVADLLDVGADFLGDLLIALLAVGGLSGVHLVDSNNKLFHSQGVGKQGMLTGLSVLRDTSLELTNTSSDNQHGTVSLGGGINKIIMHQQNHYAFTSGKKLTWEVPVIMFLMKSLCPGASMMVT